jgi:hypothetical protein
MPLQYKKGPPTHAGFYFAKRLGLMSGKEFETVVKVYSHSSHKAKPTMIFSDGDNYDIKDKTFLEFAGPIELPEGSKALQ